MTAVTKSGKTRRSPSGAGAVLLAAAGLAGSFGVAACCALPFLLAGVGLA
jgi:mercuric ion transport protein